MPEQQEPPAKRCNGCDTHKSPTEFYKHVGNPDGLQYRCKACSLVLRNKFKAANPERHKAQQNKYGKSERGRFMKATAMRAKRYGLDRAGLLEIVATPCGICGGVVQAIDHCHESGKVRGGLCRPCNTGLGFFKDSEQLLATAIDYLRKARKT